jgi:hypothetical protein
LQENNPNTPSDSSGLTLNLDAIAETSPPSKIGEDVDEKSYLQDIEQLHRKEDLAGKKQDREERKKYADKIFCLIAIWLISVLLILLLAGFGKDITHSFSWNNGEKTEVFTLHTGFTLDNDVLIALLGGTTASVIGIFVIVANYLFPRRPTS